MQSRARTMAEILANYGVPIRVAEVRGGWIETHCCWCRGSADFHLGFSVARQTFTCWRCGGHPTIETLERLCRVSRSEAAALFRETRGSGPARPREADDRALNRRIDSSRLRHPSDSGPMRGPHRRYLEGRNFDPDRIEREWGVLGTGPAAYLDDGAGRIIDYRSRLLIPVFWDGREVSFQARDATGRSELRYVSCPPALEVVHHKRVLYGRQERWGDVGIVVEGVTDAWRLGPLACATLGVAYATEQVVEIARRFRRVAIVFDPEPAAQRQARRLAGTLRLRTGVDPVVVGDIGAADPGSMAQDDADHLVRELTK